MQSVTASWPKSRTRVRIAGRLLVTSGAKRPISPLCAAQQVAPALLWKRRMAQRRIDSLALEAELDRRADARRPSSQRVRYEIAGVGAGEALCWNLSRGGTCLNLGASQPVAPEGESIRLTFPTLPSALLARIVWVKTVGALRQMGLVFCEMTQAQRDSIGQLLRHG
jgi:hypothetical protein